MDEDEVILEYGVDDPHLGEVSCENEYLATILAEQTGGRAWVKTWSHGEQQSKEYI